MGAYLALRSSAQALRHEAEEAWRARLIEAAADASSAWGEARYWVDIVLLGERLEEDDRKVIDAVATKFFGAMSVLALVFNDETVQSAFKGSEGLVEALGRVRAGHAFKSDEARERTIDLLVTTSPVPEFLEVAREAVRPSAAFQPPRLPRK
jgi:hypothetical protein